MTPEGSDHDLVGPLVALCGPVAREADADRSEEALDRAHGPPTTQDRRRSAGVEHLLVHAEVGQERHRHCWPGPLRAVGNLQRAGSAVGRFAFIGKSVRGRLSVSFQSRITVINPYSILRTHPEPRRDHHCRLL